MMDKRCQSLHKFKLYNISATQKILNMVFTEKVNNKFGYYSCGGSWKKKRMSVGWFIPGYSSVASKNWLLTAFLSLRVVTGQWFLIQDRCVIVS